MARTYRFGTPRYPKPWMCRTGQFKPPRRIRIGYWHREGKEARQRFIRQRRSIERQWLGLRDYEDETLYERRKTSGWNTW